MTLVDALMDPSRPVFLFGTCDRAIERERDALSATIVKFVDHQRCAF